MKFKLKSFSNSGQDATAELTSNSEWIQFLWKFPYVSTQFEIISQKPERTAELWKSSCVEFFIKNEDAHSYIEFNGSFQGAWNFYAFDQYRDGMRELDLRGLDPIMKYVRFDNDQTTIAWKIARQVFVPVVDLNQSTLVCLSAILKMKEENLYFAIVHPADQPDFHNDRGWQRMESL